MPIPYQFYLEMNILSLNGWSPITLRLRLWHIKEVNMVLRPILSDVGRRQTALPPENQLFLCIARSPAFPDFFNISTFEQFFQAAFYGGFAYVRAKCCNIGFFYNAEFLFKHSFDPFRFGYFPILQMFDTVLKIIIPFQYYAQIVSYERCIIACIVMPADGAILQCLIICLLCFFNQHLHTDIFADNISAAIEQQQCKQTAHTAVAVIKWMNAQKIKNEHWNQQQRVVFRAVYGWIEFWTERLHRFCSLESGHRSKSHTLFPVFARLGYHIIRVLESSARITAAKAIQITVKLQDTMLQLSTYYLHHPE